MRLKVFESAKRVVVRFVAFSGGVFGGLSGKDIPTMEDFPNMISIATDNRRRKQASLVYDTATRATYRKEISDSSRKPIFDV